MNGHVIDKPMPALRFRPHAGLLVAVLCMGLLVATKAMALASDSQQPINVEADNAEANEIERITIYKGDVVITQGTMRITGDTVTVYYDEGGEMTRMITEGRPSTFRQQADGETEFRTARARRMEYLATEDRILLLGDAQYGRGASRVNAERIEYDTLTARARADTGDRTTTASDSRVRITITPSKAPGTTSE